MGPRDSLWDFIRKLKRSKVAAERAYDVRVTSFGEVQGTGAGRIEIAGGQVQGEPISLVSSGLIPVVVREEYTADSGTGTREEPVI
jgi:hypothetical protein